MEWKGKGVGWLLHLPFSTVSEAWLLRGENVKRFYMWHSKEAKVDEYNTNKIELII